MRTRVSVIIIKDNKLFLVKGSSGFYADFYFTPGGKVEQEESDEEAIVRECNEELSIRPSDIEPYVSYKSLLQKTKEEQVVNCYIVKLDTDDIKLSGEITECYWYSRQNYFENSPKIADSIYKNLIPALIMDDLIK